MSKHFVVIMLCLLFVAPSMAQDSVSEGILSSLNSARNSAGINSLVISSKLTTAAQRHSDDMAETGSLDHIGSDGTQFWQRMLDAGYSLTKGAENTLQRLDTDTRAVFNQWWNSPPHRANMMNPEFIEIGIAYSQSSVGTYFFTMVLGTREGVVAPPLPTSTPIPPTPAPPTNTPIPTSTQIPPSPTQVPSPLPTRVLPTMTLPPQSTPLPTVPTATLVPPTATPYLPPDIRLVYDATSFTLINVSGRRLNLSDLSFTSDAGLMVASVWDTEFLTERLDNFASTDCLQIWGFDVTTLPGKPGDCRTRHAWVSVGEDQLFWRGVVI